MTKDELEKVWDNPGIYCFKNKINEMCYVGQAICIKNRFKQHLTNYKINKEHKKFYYALQEFGIENFSFSILKIVEECEDLKIELDKWEMYYIKEKDSFKNGYNATLGGDGGQLGCHLGEETQEKLRQKNIERIEKRRQEGKFSFYIYDSSTELFTYCLDMETGVKILETSKENIRHALMGISTIKGRYILGKTEEEIEERQMLLVRKGSNRNHINCMKAYLSEHPEESDLAISRRWSVAPATVHKYRIELGLYKGRPQYKITKDGEEFIGVSSQCAHKIGVNPSTLRKNLSNYLGKEYRGWLIEAL